MCFLASEKEHILSGVMRESSGVAREPELAQEGESGDSSRGQM